MNHYILRKVEGRMEYLVILKREEGDRGLGIPAWTEGRGNASVFTVPELADLLEVIEDLLGEDSFKKMKLFVETHCGDSVYVEGI